MATPIQTEIFNQVVKTQVDLERFSEHVREKVVAFLEKAQGEILKALMENDPTTKSATEWKKMRLQRLNEQIEGIMQDYYGRIEKAVDADMLDLASYQQERTIEGMKRAFGVNLFDVTLTQANLEAIATQTMIDGQVIGKWWQSRPEVYRQRLEREMNKAMERIQLGLVQGESVGELVRAVRGYKSRKDGLYHAGVMDAARHEVAALVRTSVMQVAASVRQGIYEANADVLKGFQVCAVLDVRTTPLCRALDGHTYDLDRKPLNGGSPLPPGPPFHWNCRSALIPVVKSYEELAGTEDLSRSKREAMKEIDKGTRASMNGQVPEKMNYEEWLRTQDEKTQIEVLGPGRWELWQKGIIGMTDMVHQNGRPLTIEELKRKISRS